MKRILSLLCAVLLSVPAQMQASQPSNATMGGIAALGLGFGYFGYGAYRNYKTLDKIKDLKQLREDFPKIGAPGVYQRPLVDRVDNIRLKYGLPTTYGSYVRINDCGCNFGAKLQNDFAVQFAKFSALENDIYHEIVCSPCTSRLCLMKNAIEEENTAVSHAIRNKLSDKDKKTLSGSQSELSQSLKNLDRNYRLKTYGLAGLSALCLGGAAVVGWFGWKK